MGAVPKGIRRGQTLQILLALSEERQSVLVPRGGFYQQTGGNWIFKVSEDGKKAYRADIQLGNQNPDYYEVLQGLNRATKWSPAVMKTMEPCRNSFLKNNSLITV